MNDLIAFAAIILIGIVYIIAIVKMKSNIEKGDEI